MPEFNRINFFRILMKCLSDRIDTYWTWSEIEICRISNYTKCQISVPEERLNLICLCVHVYFSLDLYNKQRKKSEFEEISMLKNQFHLIVIHFESMQRWSNERRNRKTQPKVKPVYIYDTLPCLTIELVRFCYTKIESIFLHVIFGTIVAAHWFCAAFLARKRSTWQRFE